MIVLDYGLQQQLKIFGNHTSPRSLYAEILSNKVTGLRNVHSESDRSQRQRLINKKRPKRDPVLVLPHEHIAERQPSTNQKVGPQKTSNILLPFS